MKCPKCKIELEKGICLKCGYMENGNQIEQFKKHEKYTDIRLYNSDFESMNQNQKKYMNFIMGPLYFSYRNHLIAGTLISIIAFTILYLEIKLTDLILETGLLSTLLYFLNTIFYITINRVLYMSFSNVICIKLDKIKINRIKKKNKNYTEMLIKHNTKSIISLLIQILFYIIIAFFLLKT